ncbi:hypothetical protein ACHHV8_01675 [Paenibacillus sp. TAB 01]|uniref:hypothetical protein n=1 Tax=Paenibacillus sp. TAB 01 TaxID=3368988 RepID=UPI0037533AE7
MRYSTILSQYIKTSGLSLNDICNKLTERGSPIDRSYISKLKNGHKLPSNDAISVALAEVTRGDPDELIVAGFMEKAPEQLKKSILEIDFFLQDTFDMIKMSSNKEFLQQALFSIKNAEIKNTFFKKIIPEQPVNLEVSDLHFSLSILSTVGIEMLSLQDKFTLVVTVLEIFRNMDSEFIQQQQLKYSYTRSTTSQDELTIDQTNSFLVGQNHLEKIDEHEYEFLLQCLDAFRTQWRAWEKKHSS